MLVNNAYYPKVYQFLLLVIAVLLPFTEYFSVQFTSFAIILLSVAWLFLHDKKELISRLKVERVLFLFFLFYVINAQGFLRGGSNGITEKVLLKKLSLFLLPLVIGTSPVLRLSFIYKVVFAFILSLVLSTWITFSRGVKTFATTPEDLNQLAELVLIHRPYYGLLCGFAVLALIVLFNQYRPYLIKIGFILAILYFLYFISLIQAKMSLMAVLVGGVILGALWLLRKGKKKIVLALAILSISGLSGIIFSSPTLRGHLSNIASKKDFSFSEYNILVVGSINVRYVNWGCAYHIIKEKSNLIWGVGAGNAQARMQACYRQGNQWVYQNKMNTHNQYLEETLYNGLIGLSLFLALLLALALLSYRRSNFLHLAFLILFSLCCLTESILGRQIGIFFFSFFNALLFFNYKSNKTPARIHEQKISIS